MIIPGLIDGLAIGIVSGFVGIGGGALLVPALVCGFGMSQHDAQGTSLATLLLPIGAFAFWQYYQAGHVDVRLAMLLGIGFAVGRTRAPYGRKACRILCFAKCSPWSSRRWH